MLVSSCRRLSQVRAETPTPNTRGGMPSAWASEDISWVRPPSRTPGSLLWSHSVAGVGGSVGVERERAGLTLGVRVRGRGVRLSAMAAGSRDDTKFAEFHVCYLH